MKLAEMTWPKVDALSKKVVVVIPTGSLEQHGPHLPMFTDTILATGVAEAVEAAIPEKVLLVPTLWMGASAHHMEFPGSINAAFETYIASIQDVVDSMVHHGFQRFFVLNGHGGNAEPNGIAMRKSKAKYPNLVFGHSGYYSFCEREAPQVLEGPTKTIRHACEAETSLMMHLRPDLVRKDKIRDDGLACEPPIQGVIHHFDEITEQGSLGQATYATPEKGQVLFAAAVSGVVKNLEAIFGGYVFVGG